MIPQKPTPKFCEAQISFHEAGLAQYRFYGDTRMAEWSQQQITEWTAKLAALKRAGREPGDGE